MNFIIDSVRAVRRCGLYPVVVKMDQCSTNTKMAREAGATPDNPVINIDDEEIALMYDSPHLTKSARNSIFKYNASFNGAIASYSHIVKLYEVDVASPLRLAPKLVQKCIDLPPFAAMNVPLAVRTLSESCSIAMRYYVNTGELPVEALATANFIELHDKLFDVFNSKEKYSSSVGKPYRTPITSNSFHIEFLNHMLKVLQKMFYTTNNCIEHKKAKKESLNLRAMQRRPPYIKGFIGNIEALKWLWSKLKSEFGCDYLCINPLCQDCLENFFAKIRRRCGFNDAPNAFQFGCAFKYAMISVAHQNFDDGTNCQKDNAKLFLSEKEIDKASVTAKVPKAHIYTFEQFHPDETVEVLKKELNALVYIIGAAVRKLPHKKCRSKLVVENEKEYMENEDYGFCKLKASLSKRKVTIPNNTLYNIGLLAFCAYKTKFRKYLYENRRFVKKRLRMYVDFNSYDHAACKSCFDKLLDAIFNTLIQSFLRDIRLQNKIASNNKRRRKKRNREAFRMNLPDNR
ncbi:uncharacterized protein LOC134284955 isoform X2 [Aedes albopictus]|uniref:Transposable element P transposase n=1 Tax=Aedes albopictus TaxID=7160 RepID=A0ABM1YB79_AEDAL